MPLTSKGRKIMRAMEREYGKDAEQVFYASRNKGTISGVDQSGSTLPKRRSNKIHNKNSPY